MCSDESSSTHAFLGTCKKHSQLYTVCSSGKRKRDFKLALCNGTKKPFINMDSLIVSISQIF